MKNFLAVLFLLASCAMFSQVQKFQYAGRWNPIIKKEKLSKAKFISDLTDDLWNKVVLIKGDRKELEHQKNMDRSQRYFYQSTNCRLTNVILFSAVEISAVKAGKLMAYTSNSDELSAEQKDLLNSLELGANIEIRIKFRYKYTDSENKKILEDLNEGKIVITLVPEKEAEYKGGAKEFVKFINENIANKFNEKGSWDKMKVAEMKFKVDEKGNVIEGRISKKCLDSKMDQAILDALKKMPGWIPAKNAAGKNVAEEFTISFGGWGGC
jgi:hypothetical protein